MSEAELHVIKAQLRGGILDKVRRGEFRCLLPTGLVYDHFGNVTLDPDMQVRETIIHFFEMFSRLGSASQTVKVFRNEGLLFPSRLHNGGTLFRPLTASTAMRVLDAWEIQGVAHNALFPKASLVRLWISQDWIKLSIHSVRRAAGRRSQITHH
jgi:hypothetical protein